MKRIFLFIGLLMLIPFIYQCDDGGEIYETPAIRRIVNNTDYHLEIMVNGDMDTFRYNISPQSSIDIEGKCYEGNGERYCIIDWLDVAYGSIIFNDERIQRFETTSIYYTARAINSSVYNPYSYTLIKDTPTLRIYEYTITQTDYDTAEVL